MKKNALETNDFDDYFGCFGEFSAQDRICVKYCALNLRCAIEAATGSQFDILDELIIDTGMFLKIQ